MKTVMAIINIDKMNATKKALLAADITSMTASGKVFGRGKGLWEAKILEGVKNDRPEALEHLGKEPRLRAQRVLEVVVNDSYVQPAVDAIIEANQGEPHGCGKIFVMPVNDVVQVRTGTTGSKAVD
ncbi:P-II family nitrogen regulator [Saccharicrinis aurantiacus]|uniref:P-II family nitrogen regulator n=1 Tax=Saccharicrinis aurantiacus TaxID=1849719 RepID=UPI000838E49C|nr:P-II family nitrogen regulator [Saccharicrinis aurantiacus]